VHLSREDLAVLFGDEHELQPLKELSQPGEFAGREVVSLVGPNGVIEGVRIVGPCRKQSQVEISMTDSYRLGVKSPVRISGQLEGTPGITIIGPKGLLALPEGVIIAARHIHMPEDLARQLGIERGSMVKAHIEGIRALTLEEVAVRVNRNYRLELHVDTDEANSALLKNGDQVELIF
jgi:putative phosphotransacetylase